MKKAVIALVVVGVALGVGLSSLIGQAQGKGVSLMLPLAQPSFVKALQKGGGAERIDLGSTIKVNVSGADGFQTYSATVGAFEDALMRYMARSNCNRSYTRSVALLMLGAVDSRVGISMPCPTARFDSDGCFAAFESNFHPSRDEVGATVKYELTEHARLFAKDLVATGGSPLVSYHK